jgi:hypothetical protein
MFELIMEMHAFLLPRELHFLKVMNVISLTCDVFFALVDELVAVVLQDTFFVVTYEILPYPNLILM